MLPLNGIAMVNYLNSKPFAYGLKESIWLKDTMIRMATPADCAALFETNQVDVALIPVGALLDLTECKIISDYCIGCDGEVRTVCIFSNQPLESCHSLYLDNHSRTSCLLSKLILEDYFHLQLQYHSSNVSDTRLQNGEAILMIGDKVFQHENLYSYRYDLGSIWKTWTGLPFVFAVWIAKSTVTLTEEKLLNDSLSLGIEHLDDVIKKESSENLDLYYYFSHNIQYLLDAEKRKALELFLSKVKEMKTIY